MIQAECGCFITEGEQPIIDLVCDEHTASEVYGGYDGNVDKICDYLIDQLTSRRIHNAKTTK